MQAWRVVQPRSFLYSRSAPGLVSARWCSYIQDRSRVWGNLYARQTADREQKPQTVIDVKLPDQQHVVATSNVTRLSDIIKETEMERSPSEILAVEVNGEILDLSAYLTADTIISRYITFDSLVGKRLFWHSSAHLLGYALEQYQSKDYTPPEHWDSEGMPKRGDCRKVLLDDGPALDSGGFFYDFMIEAEATPPTKEQEHKFLKGVRKWMNFLVKQKEPFERLELYKTEAMELFSYNPLKLHILQRLDESETISCYRVGEFVDLCKGPHVPSLSYLKWSDLKGMSLQTNEKKQQFLRVSGISFPKAELRKEWDKQQLDAKENDHRIVGKKQQLFMSHPLSAGSPFVLPHGVTIYNRLQSYLSHEYKKRGYQEVISPNIFLKELWETSGHWQNYKENMFTVTSNHKINQVNEEGSSKEEPDQQEHFCLKPMNCPAHCLIFDHQTRSYKDMPVRLAEFGVLHRDELAGTLTGLTRVRRFVQDDAHIFCTEDQIAQEVKNCLEFVKSVYSLFDFEFMLCLSTRPEKSMGEIEQWNSAEEALKTELSQSGLPWRIKEGDGAFYGPKIDVSVTDIHHREHQCATIQLDFQLPQRFKLKYIGKDGQKHTPIMIHRAILGSFERFIAMLMEHTRGRWPLWLNPRQCLVCSANTDTNEYAQQITDKLKAEGISAEVNISGDRLGKKIKEATNLHFNYIIVLGSNEKDANTVSYRERGSADMKECSANEFSQMLREQMENFVS